MSENRRNLSGGASLATLAGVVWKAALSVGCFWLAQTIWPRSPEWWGLGLYAVVLYAASAIMGIIAVRLAIEEAVRLIRMKRFRGDARASRADRLAGDQDLEDGGLL